MFVPHNTEKIRLTYTSRHNFKRENQIILQMITDGKKWHYLTVKSLSALPTEITSNHQEYFNCLNCFHSYSTNEKLKKTWKSLQWSWLLLYKNVWWRQRNIKIQPRRKVHESLIYYLCWLRMFTWNNALVPK